MAAAAGAGADTKAAGAAAAAATPPPPPPPTTTTTTTTTKISVPPLRVLSEADVEKSLSMTEAIAVNARAFAAAARGSAVVPDRILIHGATPADGSTLFKPAAISDGGSAGLGLKIVAVRPANAAHGLPTVPAVVVLLDQHTGLPVSVMGATYLTALRTAAGSGVATDLFARADAKRLVVFGAGLQARAHVEAMRVVRPGVQHVTIVNRSLRAAQTLCDELASLRTTGTGTGTGTGGGSSNHNAVAAVTYDAVALSDTKAVDTATCQADIICACTNASTPLFDGTKLKAGVHINGVGSYRADMQELDVATVKRAHVVLDSNGALGAGDLSIPLKSGAISVESAVRGELGEFVAGSGPNNTTSTALKYMSVLTNGTWTQDITLFKSVGVAVQDIATGAAVLAAATKLGLGTTTPLA